jgi:hypothetical protein
VAVKSEARDNNERRRDRQPAESSRRAGRGGKERLPDVPDCGAGDRGAQGPSRDYDRQPGFGVSGGRSGGRPRAGPLLGARDRHRSDLGSDGGAQRDSARRRVASGPVGVRGRGDGTGSGTAGSAAGVRLPNPGSQRGPDAGRAAQGAFDAIPAVEDEFEAMFERGWTDGLPVVPPTESRVLEMLDATSRAPDEVVAVVPPNLVPATVEKVAINAVMAGCRPEYLPVVLAAVEAACTDEFNIHGVLATTYSVGPVVIVNGPVARAIGMNSGVNLLGQGNRANATIGRALQLVVRNVGGGRPGGVDRATLGNPGKVGLCFTEDEEGSPWEPLSVARGVALGVSAVTVVAGGGVKTIGDQTSRTADALAASLAKGLRGQNSLLIISPDHGRLFREAGWSRARLVAALRESAPGGIGLGGREGPELLVVYGGGSAGLFSGAMEGWVGGSSGSVPVTVEVGS